MKLYKCRYALVSGTYNEKEKADWREGGRLQAHTPGCSYPLAPIDSRA